MLSVKFQDESCQRCEAPPPPVYLLLPSASVRSLLRAPYLQAEEELNDISGK